MVCVAEELQILLHVYLLNDASLCICVCLLLGLHKEDHGVRAYNYLEGDAQNSCLHCSDSLHIHSHVVRGWLNSFPSVSHQHKPGYIIANQFNPLIISLVIFFDKLILLSFADYI